MVRETYDRELQRLQDETLALGSMVENAITDAVGILKQRDMEGSRRLIAQDRLINEKRFAIEADALALIAMQQPVAGDMRTIAAVLDITHELERIGDYAKGIAKINLLIGSGPLVKPLVDMPRMADKARDMLHRALAAFAQRDVDSARAIPTEDDDVDDLYNQIYRELATYILADPSIIEGANYLLWAAHNLERAADRVTNICERVIFTVTGKMVELDVKEGQSVTLAGIR
ncbi:MAG: phosphate signaling complex protein PhoU [Chloroflexota bacterium]|nr:phosphate signaling complex protein PhoU [Chloroflexota bacterium]